MQRSHSPTLRIARNLQFLLLDFRRAYYGQPRGWAEVLLPAEACAVILHGFQHRMKGQSCRFLVIGF
jgi:hypothetical protein